MTFSGNSEKSVAPINHKNNYRKSLPPQIDSKSKLYKKKYKKKENKGSGLLGLLFGSNKSDSHKKSGSSSSYKSDKSNKSENPKKSDSKKSNSKTNRKQTKGRR
tara:strand:- start:19 stop:330 length:312 start_codon:yes stop_codon:yes gene_type:complete